MNVAPFSFPLALHANRAAMQLDKLLNDRQPQAQAAVLSPNRRVGLAETVEDIRQKVIGNARAVIAHDDLDMRSDCA